MPNRNSMLKDMGTILNAVKEMARRLDDHDSFVTVSIALNHMLDTYDKATSEPKGR